MEAVGILDALESRAAVLPGGRDKGGRPLVLVRAPSDNSPWSKDHLDEALKYFCSIFSEETAQQGVTVVVDAQKSTWRLVRPVTRQIYQGLGPALACLLVLRPDAFWDKQRVDNCARIHKDGEAVYIPMTRLIKYVDTSQLPEELGGSWTYSHDAWIQNRVHFEEFAKGADRVVVELDRLRQRLGGELEKDVKGEGTSAGGQEELSTAEETLYDSADLYTLSREMAAKVLREGESLTDRLDREYRSAMPQDMADTRERVLRLVDSVRTKLQYVQDAWFNVQKNIVDAKEVYALEDGVQRVTEWILGAGEAMLNSQLEVGYDITSAEELRSQHEALELQCRETYGHYAELLHKIDSLSQCGVAFPEDLRSLRDFMDFVCRSFATRLERRRNVLITSTLFFRLVTEYFQVTSDVYESLVMCSDVEALDSARCSLIQLQESQLNIDLVEKELVREGEKLSDLLAMPVKDALGRELEVDYANDIVNVREVLEMTTARRQLFRDSVELQRLTLQQASHVYDYEKDAAQAVDWLNELFQVMLKTHSHVGCNVSEIQLQKDELQAFQETAKGTYEYGCQLVSVALSLRQSCKLQADGNTALSHQLWLAWKQLYTVGQEQMTRLRVSAVFHRSVHQHCKQLEELRASVAVVMGEADNSHRRSRLRKVLAARERLLPEVGRMVRLGRLLKTRLREPLTPQLETEESNVTAVEAIAEQLSTVTQLAEQLDAALCDSQGHNAIDMDKILDGTASATPEDWYNSLNKPSSKCESVVEESSKSTEEDFVTASECTCTPPSRSSSFHTASEGEGGGGGSSPWWELDPSDQEHEQAKHSEVVVQEVTETRHLKLSRTEGCSITTNTTIKEYLSDSAGNTAQVGEQNISTQDTEDATPNHRSDESADSGTADDRLTQEVVEVTATCHYYPPAITRHALTGVF